MPIEPGLPLLRLLQLVSPSLPTGAFAYSQGIEWAVEAGWIKDASDTEAWLSDQMESMLAHLDLPLVLRMQRAAADEDRPRLNRLIDLLLAYRETSELRDEEHNRGRALADLLVKLQVPGASVWHDDLARCQAAGFAFAANAWRIPARDAALGYAWSWLENLTLAAVKIIPLGQSEGQRLLSRLAVRLDEAVDVALGLSDDEIGAGTPALALAGSRHEIQYTRLFRS